MSIAIPIVSMQNYNPHKPPKTKENAYINSAPSTPYLMTNRPHLLIDTIIKTSSQSAGKGVYTMSKLNKNQMVQNLKEHGIKVAKKVKGAEVADIYASNHKILAMGNRTGSYYFGTKNGTWAGQVARAIAFGAVESTSDIRKKVTPKYSFRQTLGRLEAEGWIRYTDKNNRVFELTQRGREVAAVYRARHDNVA